MNCLLQEAIPVILWEVSCCAPSHGRDLRKLTCLRAPFEGCACGLTNEVKPRVVHIEHEAQRHIVNVALTDVFFIDGAAMSCYSPTGIQPATHLIRDLRLI